MSFSRQSQTFCAPSSGIVMKNRKYQGTNFTPAPARRRCGGDSRSGRGRAGHTGRRRQPGSRAGPGRAYTDAGRPDAAGRGFHRPGGRAGGRSIRHGLSRRSAPGGTARGRNAEQRPLCAGAGRTKRRVCGHRRNSRRRGARAMSPLLSARPNPATGWQRSNAARSSPQISALVQRWARNKVCGILVKPVPRLSTSPRRCAIIGLF